MTVRNNFNRECLKLEAGLMFTKYSNNGRVTIRLFSLQKQRTPKLYV